MHCRQRARSKQSWALNDYQLEPHDHHFSLLEHLQFIDNDAARWAIIKGYTESLAGAVLVGEYWHEENKLMAITWTGRVRSRSDIGDAASRFQRDSLSALGYEETLIV